MRKENLFKISSARPVWCSSVGWASSHKPKGHWFNSQSGHMPRFQARSPAWGVREATDWCISHWCFSPSLPPPLSKSKRNKIFKKKERESGPAGCSVGVLLHTSKIAGSNPWSGHVGEATDRCFSLTLMFLSPSPSLPLSLKSYF